MDEIDRGRASTPRPARLVSLALLVAACALSARAAGPYIVGNNPDLGGNTRTRVTEFLVDAQGNNVFAGVVGSYDFPGVDSAAALNAGRGMRFVARYDPLGRVRHFVAIVGEPARDRTQALAVDFARDEAAGLALDRNGDLWLVAYDGAKGFPLTGAGYRVPADKSIFRVSPSGAVTRHSRALDPAIRRVGAIAVDAAGNFHLTGSAAAGLVTTPGAPFGTDSVAAGCIAPFVTKLDPTGQAVVYATYLGYSGTQGERCGGATTTSVFDPTGFAIAVDAAGNAFVAGQAEPGLRATPGAVAPATTAYNLFGSLGTSSRAFVAKLNPGGTAIVYAARLGGSGVDRATAIALDPAGSVYVAGTTSSSDFPRAGISGLQAPFPARTCPFPITLQAEVGFVAKLAPAGDRLEFAGPLPAMGSHLAQCGWNPASEFARVRLARDAAGNLHVAGPSSAYERAVSMPADAVQRDEGDRFYAQLDGQGALAYMTYLSADASTAGLAVDPYGDVRIGGTGPSFQQLSPGMRPVELTVSPDPACAGTPLTLTARAPGTGSHGVVEMKADGASVGAVGVVNAAATLSIAVTAGVHRFQAIYHGPGWFDGYASQVSIVAVNQAGTCP